MRFSRRSIRIALVLVAAFVLLPLLSSLAFADDAAPRASLKYRRTLVRNAQYVWGLDVPIATFAAQIQQESRWRADAVSVVGAQGIAQFMPSTADWISGAYPALAANEPANPAWAIRALVTYDRYLWNRVSATDDCSRMAMALSAYNGGLGWVQRDQALAEEKGLNPLIWFGQVEQVNAGRVPASFAENRGYPRIILLKWQAVFLPWGKGIACP